MPLYEYQCQSCSVLTEVIQRMSESPLTTCDRCGGDLKKLISAPAFQFKGSGWYVTDYADKGKGAGEDSGKDSGKDKGKDSGESKTKDSANSDSKDSAKSSGSGKAERIMADKPPSKS